MVWVDSGDWNDLPTPEGTIKTRALLSAMDDLGYAAANVSERELAGGYEARVDLPRCTSCATGARGARWQPLVFCRCDAAPHTW